MLFLTSFKVPKTPVKRITTALQRKGMCLPNWRKCHWEAPWRKLSKMKAYEILKGKRKTMKSQRHVPKRHLVMETVNPLVSVCLCSKHPENCLESYRIIKVNNMPIMVPRNSLKLLLNCKDLVVLGYTCIPLCLWREWQFSDSWVFYLFRYKLRLHFSGRKEKIKLKWGNENFL